MPKGPKTLRSPKGLTGVTTRLTSENCKLEEIGPNQFAFKLTTSTEELIRSLITFLRNWTEDVINREGKEPAQVQQIIEDGTSADRTYYAALMLKKLDDVEGGLINVEQCSDVESLRWNALAAIQNALALASYFHAFTIADNEAAIVTGTSVSRGLAIKRAAVNAGRHAERLAEAKRWNTEAQKIWGRQPRLSKQAVAMRVKRNLALPDKVGTIAKKLKKLGTAC